MIISHKHKFIFIKTRKTASTSIEIALSTICGNNDIITPIEVNDEIVRAQVGGLKPQNIEIPFSQYNVKDYLRLIKHGKRLTFKNHMTALQVKHYVPKDIWETYFKFAFDRNPPEKLISYYKWNNKRKKYPTLDDFILNGNQSPIQSKNLYCDHKGNVILDKVYKMEEMEASFSDICKRIYCSDEKLKSPNYFTKKSSVETYDLLKDFKLKHKDLLMKIFDIEYNTLY